MILKDEKEFEGSDLLLMSIYTILYKVTWYEERTCFR